MKMTTLLIAFPFAALCSLWWLLPSDPPPREPAPGVQAHAPASPSRQVGNRYCLRTGERLDYALRLKTEVQVRGAFMAAEGEADAGQRTCLELDGDLTLSVLEAGDRTSLLRVRFAGQGTLQLPEGRLSIDEASPLGRQLALGCEAELRADGTVAGTRGAADPDGPAAWILNHLLASLQTGVPSNAAAAWSCAEQSPSGCYRGDYRRLSDSSGLWLIAKSKSDWQLGNSALRVDAGPADDGHETGMRARFDTRSGRLLEVAGTEELAMTCEGALVYSARTELRCELLACGYAPEAAGHAPLPDLETRPLFEPRECDRAAIDGALLAGMDLEALLLELPQILDGEFAARSLLMRRLAALVRLQPDCAPALAAAILAVPAGHDAEMLLIAGLAGAGTPAAEQALLAVGRRRPEAATLLRVVGGLAQIRDPSPEAEDFARAVYARACQDDPALAANTALQLGLMAARLDGTRGAQLVSELVSERPRLGDQAWLLALGNSGRPEALASILTQLAPEAAPELRALAAQALRRVPGSQAEARLLLALQDPQPEVRLAAAEAFVGRELSGPAASQLLERLAHEPDAETRAAMLASLAALRGDAGVELALQQAAARDPDEALRRFAGRLLELAAEVEP